MKINKKWIYSFGTFLCVMLILTFVSRGIYSSYLPRVEAYNPEMLYLEHVIKGEGAVETVLQKVYFASFNIKVGQICVKQSQPVKKGDPLIIFEKDDYEYILEEAELMMKIAYSENADSSLNGELNILRAKQLYEEIKECGGVIKADFDGIIENISVVEGQSLAEGTKMIVLSSMEGSVFRAQITNEEAKYIGVGDLVTLNFEGGRKTYTKLRVMNIYPSGNSTGDYIVEVDLEDKSVFVGEIGIMEYRYLNSERGICIPVAAVHSDGLSYYVYLLETREGILGQEYFVRKKMIYLADQTEFYVMLNDSGITESDFIVLSYSKELYNNQTVRMWEN